MHSLKNTIIAVLLLGVSYGVYELITTPDPSMIADENLIGPLVISNGEDNIEPPPQPQLHTRLPDAVAQLPQPKPNPQGNVGSLIPAEPPTVRQESTPPPTTPESGAIVARQPKLDFSNEPDYGNQLASADVPDSMEPKPHDHELIEALKDHLGSDEDEIESDSFNPEPQGEMTSVTTRPTQPVEKTGRKTGSFDDSVDEFEPEAPSFEAAGPESNVGSANNLDEVWSSVEELAQQQEFRAALGALTQYYNDSSLSSEQHDKLLRWLDALAGKVIYSTEHHLSTQPYIVQPDESIVEIAKNWNVTPQLVYNVNESLISDPNQLEPGTELKAISGPFHAEVDIARRTLTVFVDELYAGRFPVTISSDTDFQSGRYGVIAKAESAEATGAIGRGPFWIGLEQGLSLHAISDSTDSLQPQCIGLSSKDAADLFSILTKESQIFVKR